MIISVTKAAKEWGISRTTIYQKVNDGELPRTEDKKIDIAEMLWVFGEPAYSVWQSCAKNMASQCVDGKQPTSMDDCIAKHLESTDKIGK